MHQSSITELVSKEHDILQICASRYESYLYQTPSRKMVLKSKKKIKTRNKKFTKHNPFTLIRFLKKSRLKGETYHSFNPYKNITQEHINNVIIPLLEVQEGLNHE